MMCEHIALHPMNALTLLLLVLGELFASVNDQMLEDALGAVLSEWFI